MANAVAGLLEVAEYFPKKSLCHLTDQAAYNPFSKVAEELKNINPVKGTPILHFSKHLPQLRWNQEHHSNLIATNSPYIAGAKSL